MPRVNDDLATFIARNAVSEPFRQSSPIESARFSTYLRERGIFLSKDDLTLFAWAGVVLPIAVIGETWVSASPERFVPIDVGNDMPTFADLGRACNLDVLDYDIPELASAPELYWHPFQLWEFSAATRRLSALNIADTMVLKGRDAYQRLVDSLFGKLRFAESLSDYANGDQAAEFQSILALLLAAEPLVVESLTGELRLDVRHGDHSLEGYDHWRKSFDSAGLLAGLGLDIDAIRSWHAELARSAELSDPIASWRELVRYAPRSKRLRFRGDALKAEEYYYMAEILRRYLVGFHGVSDLPDEDRIMAGPQVPAMKERMYGKPTTTDGDRSVFRSVVRQYRLDPQPRLRWMLEGATEVSYVRRRAELRHIDLHDQGISLVNLNGVGSLSGDRFRFLLELSRDEEVFVFVSVDREERDDHVRALRRYAAEDLIPGGYALFDPNFERANFEWAELAAAANQLASESGQQTVFRGADIERECEKAGDVWKAIQNIAHQCQVRISKGDAWGRALADSIDPPRAAAERPVEECFSRALRAQTSHYQATLSKSRVGPDGALVDKDDP